MQGNASVIAALNVAYQNVDATETQAHLQEHCYETQGWDSSKWWDDIENNIHAQCKHYLMDRINALGGQVTPGWPYTPQCWPDDFQAAMRGTLDALTKCRDAYAVACSAAEEDEDYVTQKMIWGHMEWIENHIVLFEGRLTRYGKLGTVIMTGAL